MGIREYLDTHTNMEHLIWCEWLSNQWNNPSRSDYYLMRIAHAVLQTNSKKKLKFEKLKLKFTRKNKSERKLTKEEATAISKAKWLGVVGMKPVVVKKEISPSYTPERLMDEEDQEE